MLIEPLNEQCKIYRALQDSEFEENFGSSDEQRMIENRVKLKDFSGGENYSLLIQSTLLMPFLIIYISQISLHTMSLLKSSIEINIVVFILISVVFASFAFIVYSIIYSRFHGEYPLYKLITALFIFNIGSVYLLNSISENHLLSLSDNKSILFFSFMLYIFIIGLSKFWVRNLCERLQSRPSEIAESIIGMILLFFIIIMFVFLENGKSYSVLLVPLAILFFHLILILLHNEFLILYRNNHSEENYRKFEELIGVGDTSDGLYESDRAFGSD